MKDDLVERMARVIMEAYHGGCKVTDWSEAEWNPAVAEAIKAANAVLAIAIPAILEEAAKMADGGSDGFDFQRALADGRDVEYGYHSGRKEAANAIRALATTGQEGGR